MHFTGVARLRDRTDLMHDLFYENNQPNHLLCSQSSTFLRLLQLIPPEAGSSSHWPLTVDEAGVQKPRSTIDISYDTEVNWVVVQAVESEYMDDV